MINTVWASGGSVGIRKNIPICPLEKIGMQESPLEKTGTMNLVKNGMMDLVKNGTIDLVKNGMIDLPVKIGMVVAIVKTGVMVRLTTHLFIMVGAPLECGIHLPIFLFPQELGSPHGIDIQDHSLLLGMALATLDQK